MVEFKEIVSQGDDTGESEDIEEILDPEEEEEETEGGIFDEDLEDALEDALEDVASDFDIGTTMLSVAAPVESWSGQNLEDTISREMVEKDWGDDDEIPTGDIYKSSESVGDVYGASSGGDVYSSGSRGDGVYSEAGGAYDSGKEGSYSVKGSDVGALKSYDQVKEERRGSPSMLEVGGSEGKKKKEKREFNAGAVEYSAREAA